MRKLAHNLAAIVLLGIVVEVIVYKCRHWHYNQTKTFFDNWYLLPIFLIALFIFDFTKNQNKRQ